MSSIIKVAVYVVIWEFIVAVAFVIANVTIYEYVEPVFDDVANNTDFVDYNRYEARKAPILMGFDIALFILAILPFVYLFVRTLLKREQTAPPAYYPQTYQVNPGHQGEALQLGVNLSGGGAHVGL